ncbi:hypothetical protein BDW62DRAFT_208206 [Aspergillus aurantiobrunneus]
MIPESVFIVGGSVAGLLQGLQLKRQGSNVIVLEQDPSKDRHSHESGVTIGPSVIKLLERYDATGRPGAIPAEFLSAAWRRRPRVVNTRWARNMCNWGGLYLILRANFDGLPSPAVPEPPAVKEGDGTIKGQVVVQIVDVTTGESGRVSAEMVIAEDGIHSTVRQLLQVPTRKQYAGYIAWRGAVPEKLLSAQTGTYFISYIIPTEGGDVHPGKRLINWVWYYVVPENSAEMKQIFTDIHGKLHSNTVPQGLLNPGLWATQLARYLPQMTKPLAEVISSTSRVFVTKVGEAQCTSPTAFNGHLVLVGDAFTGFRSHLGKASEQAAQHALQIDRVWHGEISQQERNREAVFYVKRLVLLNRLMGFTGLGWVWAVVETGLAYIWLLVV